MIIVPTIPAANIFPSELSEYLPRECKVADIWWPGEEPVLVGLTAEWSQSGMVVGGGSSDGSAELLGFACMKWNSVQLLCL